MTVTTDGRIVAAAGAGDKAGVYVFSPDGKLLEVIPTPEDPANVEFGGDDGKTLYICAGRSLYRIKTTMTGFRLWPPVDNQWSVVSLAHQCRCQRRIVEATHRDASLLTLTTDH